MQKRLNEIGKKSEADRKAQNKLDDEMRKINEAAMKSYAKDISEGNDLTSRRIGGGASSAATSSRAVDPMALPYYEEEDGPRRPAAATSSTSIPAQNESMWCEAKTDEGHTYYWNIKTNGEMKIC